MEFDESLQRMAAVSAPTRRALAAARQRGDIGPENPYIAMSVVADAITRGLVAEPEMSLLGFFRVVEDLLRHGTPELRKIVIVGLLEDIQNQSLSLGIDLAAYDEWLGQETRLAWQSLNDIWSGRLAPEDFNARTDPPAK